MVNLEKMNIVGIVPLTDETGDNVIGRAKVEKLRSGALVFHADIAPEHRHILEGGGGFKMGDFSIAEGN